MKNLKLNKSDFNSWKYSYKSLYYYVNITLYFPLWPVFPREMHANFSTRAYARGTFPIPTFLRDSDEAPVGGKLDVNHAMGGAAHCVRLWRNPPQDRQF